MSALDLSWLTFHSILIGKGFKGARFEPRWNWKKRLSHRQLQLHFSKLYSQLWWSVRDYSNVRDWWSCTQTYKNKYGLDGTLPVRCHCARLTGDEVNFNVAAITRDIEPFTWINSVFLPLHFAIGYALMYAKKIVFYHPMVPVYKQCFCSN